VVVLGSWVVDVIIYEVDAIKAICKYVCVSLSGLYGFYGYKYGVELGS
jgi:hypothetical protein